jgi:pyrimidine-specific ribonucleoside hydrolase
VEGLPDTTMRRWTALMLGVMLLVVACDDGGATETTVTTATPAVTSAVTTGPSTTVAPDLRTPVILDYSPTVSDLGALAFVAAHPDLRLVAVTLPGTGESYCEPGVAHTRGVLVELGLDDVPVACGPEDPTTGWNAFPTSWRVASSEMDLPLADPNEERSAPDLIVDLVTASDTPIEILAVGPLTNLAVALEQDPSITERVGGITIMGGAVDVPGNVFRNEVGEWNIWVDPTAAGVVLASGAPVTLVPLDATNDLPSSPVFFESLEGAQSTPHTDLVETVWRANPDASVNEAGFWFFWDELAAAVLVDESLVTFEERLLVVHDDLRETKGWTEQAPGGSPVRVATSADRIAFEQLFLDTLAGEPTELAYIEATPAEAVYFEELSAALAAFQAGTNAELEEAFEASGLDPAAGDDAFLLVLEVALPAIFDGPFADLGASLVGVTAPPTLQDRHVALVNGLDVIVEARDDILGSLATAGDLEALEAFFGDFDEACSALQEEADARALAVELPCF